MTASPCLDLSAGFADDNEDFANDPNLVLSWEDQESCRKKNPP
jgi:hypothetical protein